MNESKDGSPQRGPTEKERQKYYARLEGQFSRELGILGQEDFRARGGDAKEKGFFIAERAIVRGAFALKLAHLTGLSPEETELLRQTALLNAAMRRVQIERTGLNATSEERNAVDREGEALLRKYAVDDRVIEIRKAHYAGAKFWTDAVNDVKPMTPEQKMIFRLQKYSAYIHNCTHQKITVSATGSKTQETRIDDWRLHLGDAEKIKTPGTALDKVTVRGREVSNFDMQRMMTQEIEEELTAEMRNRNPDIQIGDEKPVWKLIREQIDSDILQLG